MIFDVNFHKIIRRPWPEHAEFEIRIKISQLFGLSQKFIAFVPPNPKDRIDQDLFGAETFRAPVHCFVAKPLRDVVNDMLGIMEELSLLRFLGQNRKKMLI